MKSLWYLVQDKSRRPLGMDSGEFRKRGREMVDYIADYMETISLRRVTPSIEPGYLRNYLPHDPPKKGEEWETIMKDVDRFIMPGVCICFLYSLPSMFFKDLIMELFFKLRTEWQISLLSVSLSLSLSLRHHVRVTNVVHILLRSIMIGLHFGGVIFNVRYISVRRWHIGNTQDFTHIFQLVIPILPYLETCCRTPLAALASLG